jgi:transcriptional regulator with XRE-family HTH domain
MINREGLDRFVLRVLKEKDLTPTDVERRSSGGISDSYVALIIAGKVKNISLDKLKALARGLDLPADEVMKVACGMPLSKDEALQESEFAELFKKYNCLTGGDKSEVRLILEIVDREIDRRLYKNNSVAKQKTGRRV